MSSREAAHEFPSGRRSEGHTDVDLDAAEIGRAETSSEIEVGPGRRQEWGPTRHAMQPETRENSPEWWRDRPLPTVSLEGLVGLFEGLVGVFERHWRSEVERAGCNPENHHLTGEASPTGEPRG